MTVEKPKPRQLLRPITTGANSATNQSQFLAITCNTLKAREKSSVRGAIGFGFASHWLKNWRESFKPITKRSNRNYIITFDSHLKTALMSIISLSVKEVLARLQNTRPLISIWIGCIVLKVSFLKSGRQYANFAIGFPWHCWPYSTNRTLPPLSSWRSLFWPLTFAFNGRYENLDSRKVRAKTPGS